MALHPRFESVQMIKNLWPCPVRDRGFPQPFQEYSFEDVSRNNIGTL